MAITDGATAVAATGYVLLGATTATEPTQTQIDAYVTAKTPVTGLTDLGHTSSSDVIAFGQDGGDSTVLGSWQNPSLLEVVTDPPTDFFTIPALQIDNTVLALYYGGGNATVTGKFAIPDTAIPTEQSCLVIFVSANGNAGLWTPRTSIRRDDAINVATDDFVSFPLRFTLLKKAGAAKQTWIRAGLGA